MHVISKSATGVPEHPLHVLPTSLVQSAADGMTAFVQQPDSLVWIYAGLLSLRSMHCKR